MIRIMICMMLTVMHDATHPFCQLAGVPTHFGGWCMCVGVVLEVWSPLSAFVVWRIGPPHSAAGSRVPAHPCPAGRQHGQEIRNALQNFINLDFNDLRRIYYKNYLCLQQ